MLFETPNSAREPRAPNGSGKWRIEGDEIRIVYDIYQRTTSGQGRLLPLNHIVETVILKPEGGGLEAISGTLPEFGF